MASLGGDPNLAFDEWRALVRCERGLGQFQLSWNAKPMQSQMIIHGTNGVLRVDLFAMFHGSRAVTPLPKAAERVVNAYATRSGRSWTCLGGAWKFLRKEVQAFQGLRDLVADFYRRLDAGEPPPVSIEDAAVIVEWVEKVAARRRGRSRSRARSLQPAADGGLPRHRRVRLARLGGRAAAARRGQARARVRAADPREPDRGRRVRVGNLGDPDAVDRAVAGAERVIHCGAAMAGGWPEHYGSTVVGTRNVIEACRRHDVRQLVHISSMSVVDWAGSRGGPLDESTPLEPRPEERGAYTRAKLEAELERERRCGPGPAGRDPAAGSDLRRRHRC